MRISNLFESYSQYSQSRWIHFTNNEMLTIRLTTFHSDPSGIYFFPENYVPESSMWAKMTYKFIVTLKPDARILDLPDITDDDLQKMLVGMNSLDIFNAELQRYPLEGDKKVKRAWEILRGQPSAEGGSKANWNKIVRNLGYDAIFDDAGIIHFAEPIQLLVLNPSILNIVDREQPKRNYFEKMTKIVAELKTLCQPFGTVEVEGPKMLRGWSSRSPKALGARLSVKRSEKNYADFKITLGDTPTFEHIISVSLSYSRPSLGYGSGAQFNAVKNAWEHKGLETISRDLQKIFKEDDGSSP